MASVVLLELICRVAIGVFQEYYETHQLQSFSSSVIAWIPSIEVFILMFMVGTVTGTIIAERH